MTYQKRLEAELAIAARIPQQRRRQSNAELEQMAQAGQRIQVFFHMALATLLTVVYLLFAWS